jgi:hypothetical protein
MLAKQQNTRVVCLWRTENYYYEELKQQQKYSSNLNFSLICLYRSRLLFALLKGEIFSLKQ